MRMCNWETCSSKKARILKLVMMMTMMRMAMITLT